MLWIAKMPSSFTETLIILEKHASSVWVGVYAHGPILYFRSKKPLGQNDHNLEPLPWEKN